MITAEYEHFFLVNAYVPNSGRGLVRLDYRMKWDEDFRAYLGSLNERKPVILCGDLNVAHQEIDIANPKSNRRNAGFTDEERANFSRQLADGFEDTFRALHPDQADAYTFWTYMSNARARNIGWSVAVVVRRRRQMLVRRLLMRGLHASQAPRLLCLLEARHAEGASQ